MTESLLESVVVVLYEPQDPVNIAATVRAMKNMGVHRLRLVRPVAYDVHAARGDRARDDGRHRAHRALRLVRRRRRRLRLRRRRSPPGAARRSSASSIRARRRASCSTPRPTVRSRSSSGARTAVFRTRCSIASTRRSRFRRRITRRSTSRRRRSSRSTSCTSRRPTRREPSRRRARTRRRRRTRSSSSSSPTPRTSLDDDRVLQDALSRAHHAHAAVADLSRVARRPRALAAARDGDRGDELHRAQTAAGLTSANRRTSFSPMPFRRFFERGAKDAPRPRHPRPPTTDSDEARPSRAGAEETGEPEVAAEHDERGFARPRARRCCRRAPRPAASAPRRCTAPTTPSGPTHYVARHRLSRHRRRRQRVPRLHDGARLGRARLRGAERHARGRRRDRAAETCRALSSVREVDVAERLCGVIPCADKVQFLKTGAEAMAAAVRIARTYTARDVVIGCGYFGWLDWSADDDRGRAAGNARRFSPRSVRRHRRARGGGRRRRARSSRRSCIEPVIERLPSQEWINRARELATSTGAVLIFDEIKTGFRLRDRRLSGSSPTSCPISPRSARRWRTDFRSPRSSAIATSWTPRARRGSRRRWRAKSSALAAAGAVLDVARHGRRLRVALVDRRGHATRRRRRDRGERGAGHHGRRTRSDVDACASTGRSASGAFSSSARRTACCSSAARTTTPRWRTTTTRFAGLEARRERRARRAARRGGGGRRLTARAPGAPLGGGGRSSTRTRTFYHARTGRADWADVNAARFRAGERIGVTYHVASILGTWGFSSPTYFPSPDDVTLGNDAMLELCAREPDRVRMFVDGESELHRSRARRDRAVRRARRDRHQAARQPSRRRSAARPDRRARGRASAADPAPHLAAPHARVAVARDL